MHITENDLQINGKDFIQIILALEWVKNFLAVDAHIKWSKVFIVHNIISGNTHKSLS